MKVMDLILLLNPIKYAFEKDLMNKCQYNPGSEIGIILTWYCTYKKFKIV